MTTAAISPEDATKGHEEHGLMHPSDKKYVIIALILGGITTFEIGLYYAESSLKDFTAPMLLAGSALKFFLVVAFFMHLRFDNKILRRMFVASLCLSLVVYFIVLISMGAVFGRPRQPRPTIDAVAPALSQPAAG